MSYIYSTSCMYLKMPGVPKNVMMQLAEISNDHGFSWPSIEFLCMRTGWGRTAVIEALNFLEEQGVIWRDKSNGRGTKYWLTPANWKGEVHSVKERDQSATRTGPPRALVRQTDPTSPPGGPDPSARRTLIPLNTKEPKTPQPPDGGVPGFDEFFKSFPKQVDEDKAREQWDRLAPNVELQAVILAAVVDWRVSAQWQKEGGTLIPKPHNWLRNKGWRNVAGVAPVPRKTEPSPLPRGPLVSAPVPEGVRKLRESLGRKVQAPAIEASMTEGALHAQ